MEVYFSIDEYDSWGEREPGFFLHFGDNVRVKVGMNVKSLDELIEKLQSMKQDIEENHLR